jgi:integrase
MEYKYRTSFTFAGKRYWVKANTKEELYSKKALRMRDLEEGRVVISGNTTVEEWSRKALAIHKAKTDNYKNTIYQLEKHVLPYIGAVPLRAIKPIQLDEIMKMQEGMSYSHVTKIYQLLKFIFRKAKDNDLIVRDPTENLVKPKSVRGVRRSITAAERKAIMSLFDRGEFPLFELMLFCGCRPEEAARVNGKDFQVLEGRTMLHIRGTKTENSDRWVPCPPRIWGKRPKGFDLYAPNRNGNPYVDSSYRRLRERLYRELNIAMGCRTYRNALVPPYPLSEDFVPYCLRHTYCTDLARAGVDVRVAQKLMGHANISITADIYTHIDMSELFAAGELLQAVGSHLGSHPNDPK